MMLRLFSEHGFQRSLSRVLAQAAFLLPSLSLFLFGVFHLGSFGKVLFNPEIRNGAGHKASRSGNSSVAQTYQGYQCRAAV